MPIRRRTYERGEFLKLCIYMRIVTDSVFRLFFFQFYRVANYGLMDQMAALHWIQQNIEKFGGNPSMITLVGHGTGAACIDFLMSSPTMGKNFC